jgi:predicted NUDIX family NTP pyrophosphohydrolase
MPKRERISAGLLLFRRCYEMLEVFLAHPGGPFWTNKDAGAWTIPKGELSEGEEPLAAACREFLEETGIEPRGPFLPLGEVRQKAGKLVHAWAWEGDADPSAVKSNVMKLQWPPGTGRWISVPEIDRCAWFNTATANEKINAAQVEFLKRLELHLQTEGES